MKKIALLLVLTFALFSPKAFGAESDLTVSLDTINFGHEGTEKTLYLTNKGAGDFFWSAKTDAPWLAVEPVLGKIDNPQRLPANAPYQFSNMWPKLPQPWYFIGVESVGIDHEGSIYVVDSGANRIKKFNKYEEFLFEVGSDNFADGSYLYDPSHIAFDSENNFYVTTGKVKKFDKNGKFIAVIGKNKPAGQSYFDIAIDSQGNIYTTDVVNICVDKFDKEGNYLKSWGKEGMEDGEFNPAGGGLYGPDQLGIVVDSRGNVYVADRHYRRIQKFDSEGNFIKKWMDSNQIERDWQLGETFAIDAQDVIYIGDEHSNINKFDAQLNHLGGISVQIVLDGDGNDAAIAWNGTFYIGSGSPWSKGGRSIIKCDVTGRNVAEWKSYDRDRDGMFDRLYYIRMAVDNTGNIYVIDGTNRLQIFNPNGGFIVKWDLFAKFKLDFGWNSVINLDSDRNIYISRGRSIIKFNPQGEIINTWQNDKFYGFQGLAVDSMGNIYVSYYPLSGEVSFVVKLDAAGNIIKEWDSSMVGGGHISSNIAIDSRDNFYIVDKNGENIYKFNSDGNLVSKWRFVSAAGRGGSFIKCDISIDTKDNIYVVNNLNEIQKYDPIGNILFSWGQRGTKEGELFNMTPAAIAVGPNGRVYVADTGNNRIQVFSQAVQPVKVSLDRSKLPARTNEAKLELYNDSNAFQAPVGVRVLAYGPNHAPELALMGNKTVDEGRLLEFTISATDADSDTLTYSATGLPQGAKFDPATRKFSWTPSKTQSGTYQVTFNVFDGELSSSKTANITVNDVPNQPPIAQISAKPVSGRSPLKVKFSADKSNDPDGSVKWYLWEFGDGSTSSKKNPEHTFSHSLKKDVTYKVVLTVIDNEGAQSSAETTIIVNPKKKESWWSRLWPF